jgi:GH15 family glucan-1,4-alpha-glucosidase
MKSNAQMWTVCPALMDGSLPVHFGSGELEKAQLLFEKLLGYANHLGLYSEELGEDGRHLGNFPQAFTHLALISAATYLDRALSSTKRVWQ